MKRNYQVDFFRGLLLILIAINHFISEDNILMRVTREGIGWVTGASGFVFLSGFTVGMVYTKKYLKEGEGFIRATAFKRAWLIYRYHFVILSVSLLLLFIVPYLRHFWQEFYVTFLEQPALSLLLGGLFLYQPRNLDILPMYAIFLLFVPWVIKAMHKGVKWQLLVVAISFLLYLLGTFRVFDIQYNVGVLGLLIDTGNFYLLSWQFIFVAGLFMGYLSFNNKLDVIFGSKLITILHWLLSCFYFC